MEGIPGETIALIGRYGNNLAKDPAEPKFRRIRLANARFAGAWAMPAVQELMIMSGWAVDGEHLVLPPGESVDTFLAMLASVTPAAAPTGADSAAKAADPDEAKRAESERAAKKARLDAARARQKEAAAHAVEEKRRIREQLEADRSDCASCPAARASRARELKFGAKVTKIESKAGS